MVRKGESCPWKEESDFLSVCVASPLGDSVETSLIFVEMAQQVTVCPGHAWHLSSDSEKTELAAEGCPLTSS